MHLRLHKALLAFVFGLSFILNGSAMPLAHDVMPAHPMKMAEGVMHLSHAGHDEKHHPCCPQHGQKTASCAADCCTIVLPMMAQSAIPFSFVKYQPRPKPTLALSSRTLDPPSRPPQV